jgi:undecaprenyl-diphosphatase
VEFLQVIMLAVVQGATGFLPVSSSGHLVLVRHFLPAVSGDAALDAALHGSALVAVVAVYRREIRRLLDFDAPAVQYVVALFVGTLPAVAAGLLLKDRIGVLFADPRATAVALAGTGLILLSTRAARSEVRRVPGDWHPVPPSLPKALLIGCAQAVAIVPGFSRPGSTIAASLWLGLPRDEAARFSFLLAAPVIAGALILRFFEGGLQGRTGPFALAAGAVVACAVGMVAIRLTALLVVQKHFWKFSFYCLPLGAAMYVLLGR